MPTSDQPAEMMSERVVKFWLANGYAGIWESDGAFQQLCQTALAYYALSHENARLRAQLDIARAGLADIQRDLRRSIDEGSMSTNRPKTSDKSAALAKPQAGE